MPLSENDAAKIILIRSIEECDKRAFSEQLQTAAFIAAKQVEPRPGAIERYASHLFEHLSTWHQAILQLAKIPTPWTLPVCFAALLAGVATNLLGPAEKIHVVRNSVFILVAWNLIVYFTLLVAFFVGKRRRPEPSASSRSQNPLEPSDLADGLRDRPRSNKPKVPWVVRYLLPGVWQFLHRMIFGFHEQKTLAQVIRRFNYHWLSVAGPLVVARWRCLLHLGSLCLATGAVAGMYFRGLFQGYEVVWASTFITNEQAVSRLIGVLFGPSLVVSNLLGLGLADEISVARLLTPQGDDADAWIHLFAITVVMTIVFPRVLLALWQWRQIEKLSGDIALPLDSYYGEVIEGPLRLLIGKEVEAEIDKFSANVASFVGLKLYDEQIVPRLRTFRQEGGKIAGLKFALTRLTEAFLPQLTAYIADSQIPELQRSLSRRVGEVLKSIGTSFVDFKDPPPVVDGLKISAADNAEWVISNEFSRAISLSVGASIALALATVGGGVGEELGIAIIAVVLGTSGPVGFLIGLIAGAVVAAGAWWLGREKITATVESLPLPGAVVRTILWESRFQRLVVEARQKCEDSVRAKVGEKMHTLKPQITAEILIRVRGLWRS